MHASHDPYDFRTDALTQKAGLNLMANIMDATINVQRSTKGTAPHVRAAKYLASLPQNPRVLGLESKACNI